MVVWEEVMGEELAKGIPIDKSFLFIFARAANPPRLFSFASSYDVVG